MKYVITLPGNPRLYLTHPLPPGWEAVGEIKRIGDFIGGALVRYANTGIYAQCNAGNIRTLDQREVGLALAATAGVDLESERLVTASEGAQEIGKTRATINRWKLDNLIEPVPGTRPEKFRLSDLVAVANRPNQAGRPRKKDG